jgi:hypothetical protein
MRPRMWLALVLVAALLTVGVAHAAFSGGEAAPHTAKSALTPEQKAARKKLLATAAYLNAHKLSCGCQHHFASPKDPTTKP